MEILQSFCLLGCAGSLDSVRDFSALRIKLRELYPFTLPPRQETAAKQLLILK